MALYENLLRQLEKEGKFKHVYRDGDRNASSAADVIVLHSLVRGFKAGSERLRQVTTVAGATSDRKSTRLNSSHSQISYAVFCLKKKTTQLSDATRATTRSCRLS